MRRRVVLPLAALLVVVAVLTGIRLRSAGGERSPAVRVARAPADSLAPRDSLSPRDSAASRDSQPIDDPP